MADHGFTSTSAAARPAAVAAAPVATLGLAAASWVVAVWQMHGMDMGVGTRLGSFGFFIAVWVVMMAAMMLPGAARAVLRRAQASGGVRAVPLFVGSYLAVWALAGVAVYALDRPHGSMAAGAVVVAAGAYELTPVKRHFRGRCRSRREQLPARRVHAHPRGGHTRLRRAESGLSQVDWPKEQKAAYAA
jgi:predicted metal-binding integral membrane protein DUF2182